MRKPPFSRSRQRVSIVVALALTLCGADSARAQQLATASDSGKFVAVGLFIASIEEGARIFTPVRLLPFEHAEALGHQFPTVLQFHGGEDRLLVLLGRHAGLLVSTTLQRYPTEPDSIWPYAQFERPPLAVFEPVVPERKPPSDSPLPGLRAVAYLDGNPLAFIIDTRGLTLAERGMTRGTSSGLDISREQLLSALSLAAKSGPRRGPWILVFESR